MLSTLQDRYATGIDEVLGALRGVRFDTRSFTELHAHLTSARLVERHTLPFFLTLEDAGRDWREANDYLTAALLAHTSPITHLDGYTDGAAGPASVDDLVQHAGYSLAAIYRASILAASLEHGSTLIVECFPVSAFVTERMFLDGRERLEALPARDEIEDRCNDYISSRTSRLLGCGYFEVMARAALASQGSTADAATADALVCLRMLRQVTDEVIDLVSDLRAGLVTLPALLLLRERDEPARRAIELVRANGDETELLSLLSESGAPDALLRRCSELHARGVANWRRSWGDNAAFTVLFDIRLSYLHEEIHSSIAWMRSAFES